MAFTDFPNPFRPAELSQAEADAFPGPWGLIYLNGDRDWLEFIRRNGSKSGIITFDDHIDAEDAFVDSAYNGSNPNIYPSIQEAINSAGVAILVKAPGDDNAITIASGDSVQRLLGKDADTTTVPVDLTVSKSDVTIQDLGFSSKTLTLSAGFPGQKISDLYFSATGKLVITSSLHAQVHRLRFIDHTATPVEINSDLVTLANAAFRQDSGTIVNSILIPVGSNVRAGMKILDNNIFTGTGDGQVSGYAIDVTQSSSGRLDDSRFIGNHITSIKNGGMHIIGTGNVIAFNHLATASIPAGAMIQLDSPTGQDVDTVVHGNVFDANGSADVCFEYVGADADGQGLIFSNNTAISTNVGTFKGSQDMMWLGNAISGVIDFRSKTGQVVIGGDMTDATLQNIPADIVFRNVKGQDDRGDYLPVDGTVDLGSDAKRFAELWLSGNADIEGALLLGGDVQLSRGAANALHIPDDVFVLENQGLVIGHTAQIDFGATPEFQVLGTNTPSSSMGFARFEDGTSGGPDVRFLKSRGANIGDILIVQDGDTLGRFRFQGDDGFDYNTTAGEVLCRVDGAPSLNRIPGVIVFRTRIAGGGLADKMLIDNAGRLSLPITGSAGGLLIGGDAQLYRSAANTLRTPDGLVVDGTSTLTGNVSVGGTVDGVDIAARDHAASHTAVSHSDQGATGAELETLTDASNADALHAHDAAPLTYAPAATADWDGGTDPGDVDDALDQLAERVEDLELTEIWFPVSHHTAGTQEVVGSHPAVKMDDTQKVLISGVVPADWVSTVSCYVRLIPDATETIQIDYSITATAVGQDKDDTKTENNDETKDVTIELLTEWDITSLLPSLAAGDQLGFGLLSDTSDIFILGIRFIYQRGT